MCSFVWGEGPCLMGFKFRVSLDSHIWNTFLKIVYTSKYDSAACILFTSRNITEN